MNLPSMNLPEEFVTDMAEVADSLNAIQNVFRHMMRNLDSLSDDSEGNLFNISLTYYNI